MGILGTVRRCLQYRVMIDQYVQIHIRLIGKHSHALQSRRVKGPLFESLRFYNFSMVEGKAVCRYCNTQKESQPNDGKSPKSCNRWAHAVWNVMCQFSLFYNHIGPSGATECIDAPVAQALKMQSQILKHLEICNILYDDFVHNCVQSSVIRFGS